MYIHWDRPRLWSVRLYKPSVGRGGQHYTLGILAESVDRAIEAAQLAHPTARIESVNDKGNVDIVIDIPSVDLLKGI